MAKKKTSEKKKVVDFRSKLPSRPLDYKSVETRAKTGNKQFDSFIKQDFDTYKPKDGENHLRFLPPTWAEPEDFGLSAWVHFSVGPDESAYLCLQKMNGEKCPVCEERAIADRQGDEEYAKQLVPKHRLVAYLIDRNEEEKGPQLWAMPFNLAAEINTQSLDKVSQEVLPFDDVDEGFDVFFERVKAGRKFPQYEGVQIARRSSPLSDDSDLLNEWMEFVIANPIPEVLQFYSYEHIANVFGGDLTEAEDSDDSEDSKDKEGKSEEIPFKPDEEEDEKGEDSDESEDEEGDEKEVEKEKEDSKAERRRERLNQIRNRRSRGSK